MTGPLARRALLLLSIPACVALHGHVAQASTVTWNLLHSSPRDARMSAPVVYDPVRARFISFGGFSAGSYHGDVWVRPAAGGDWTLLPTTSPGPAPRFNSAVIYDPNGDRLIVCGGTNGTTVFSDTWMLSLGATPTWTPVVTLHTPGSRTAARAAYDPVRRQMVMFGGFSSVTSTVSNSDLLTLSLTGSMDWASVFPSGGPPPGRYDATLVYVPATDAFVLFSGYSTQSSAYLNDVWRLTLGASPTWTHIVPAGVPPSGRYGAAASYDPVHSRVLISGGYNGLFQPDLWALDPVAWSWTSLGFSPPGPPARDFAALATDPTTGRSILVSGNNGSGQLVDDWLLDLDASAQVPTWTALPTPVGPHDRRLMGAAFDTRRNRAMIFGGYGSTPGPKSPAQSDLWLVPRSASEAWTPIAAASPPPPLYDLPMFYDPTGDQIVIWGGYDGPTAYDITYGLSLAAPSAWNSGARGGPPEKRAGEVVAYDSAHSLGIMFGGNSLAGGGVMNDVWSFSFVSPVGWGQLQGSLSPGSGTVPTQRRYAAFVYDPDDDQFILSGGLGSSRLSDTWLMKLTPLPTWQFVSQVVPGVVIGPDHREGPAAVWDPLRHRMLEFGGRNGDAATAFTQDLWAFDPHTVLWEPVTALNLPPPARANAAMFYDPSLDRLLLFGGYDGTSGLGDVWEGVLSGGPTATLADVIESRTDGDRALLGWQLGGSGGDGAITLERRVADGAWSARATLTPDGQHRVAFEDDGLAAGTTYGYRLELPQPDGSRIAAGETSVTPGGARPALALAGAWPNPAVDVVAVAFSLPDAGPATLELFDLGGRRLARRAVGALGPGSHTLRLDETRGIEPGLYFARLEHDREHRVVRLSVVR